MRSFYEFEAVKANGEPVELSVYKGNVALVVNVASQCGYTPQYAGLETLYRTYRNRGFRILAFPCNDFGGQEPGTIDEIVRFCREKYDVTFDLFAKVHVVGAEMHPLYRWLTAYAQPAGDVQWNFEKFLIARDGKIAGRYASRVTPDDPEFVGAIERELSRNADV